MIDRATLEALPTDALREWLLDRVRQEKADPPLRTDELESPQDFVLAVHEQTPDLAFRSRLEAAIASLLEALSVAPDLKEGRDARAAAALAATAQALRLAGAEPPLRSLALRGRMGGAGSALDPAAEEAILAALTVVQAPNRLRDSWLALWEGTEPRLWALALTGLRRSDSATALSRLPEVLRRMQAGAATLPVGEILWSFRADPNIGDSGLAKELARLGADDRSRCRRELEGVGAPSEVLAALFPQATPGGGGGGLPHWADPGPRRLARSVPRLDRVDKVA